MWLYATVNPEDEVRKSDNMFPGMLESYRGNGCEYDG